MSVTLYMEQQTLCHSDVDFWTSLE